MKTRIKYILTISLTLVFLINGLNSCNKDENKQKSLEGVPTTVTVSINDGVSKTEPSNVETKTIGSIKPENENKINSIQVFIFRKDGILEATSRCENSTSVNVKCTSGIKDIYAIVNTPSINNITTLEQLKSYDANLKDNANSNLMMIGNLLNYNLLAKGVNNVSIDVKRIVARISIKNIKAEFSEVYKDASLKIEEIYVINAVGKTNLSVKNEETRNKIASDWINKGKYNKEVPELTYDKLANNTIRNSESYNKTHYFYVFANNTKKDSFDDKWCDRFTRLVVKAKVNNILSYYTVNIKNIERNKLYTITDLIITRPGKDQPDIEETETNCNFKIKVAPWEDEAIITETY